MKIKLECCHADTCLPDYWSGPHLPHVQIPVYNGMTLKEIKEAIVHEIRQGCVMGSNLHARLLAADFIHDKDEQVLADKLIKAVYAAINRMKPNKKGQRKFFTNLDIPEDEDCCDSVYAYFVFVEID